MKSIKMFAVVVAVLALTACGSTKHVVKETTFVVPPTNTVYHKTTKVPDLDFTGCGEELKGLKVGQPLTATTAKALGLCLNSRTANAMRALDALGSCNADKLKIIEASEEIKKKNGSNK